MDDDNRFEEWKDDKVLAWDAKKARRMVWRTRFSMAVTVLGTLFILFLLYGFYMSAVNISYDRSGNKTKFDRYVTTYVETHYTGIQVEKMGGVHAEISPFLTQTTTLKLYQSIGGWKTIIGKVHAKKRLFGDIHFRMDLEKDYLNQQTAYKFAVPPDLLGRGGVGTSRNEEQVWNRLQKIGDGHVAQMAFSIKKGMTPEKLQQLLADDHVRLLQMPVYSGELTTIKDVPSMTSGGPPTDTFVSHLTLRPWVVTYDKHNRLSGWAYFIGDQNSGKIQKTVKLFRQDLEWLLQNGDYNGHALDERRLDYLKKNGVKVYGAVVTGPVQALEKLKNEKAFYEFQLGRVELWNWR